MNRSINDKQFQFEVAHAVYQERMTQRDVANRFGVDEVQIGRVLRAAVKERVVEFIFNPPLNERLALALKRRYPTLVEVFIVPTVQNYSDQLKLWGHQGSIYFQSAVRSGMRVGLGGGMTLFEMIMAMPAEIRNDVHFYATAILGRSDEAVSHIAPTTLVTLLWAKSGSIMGNSHFVTTAPYDPGPRDMIASQVKALEARQLVQTYLEELKKIDIAFLSLGLIDFDGPISEKYKFTMTRLLEPNGVEARVLSEEGAVGDFNYSFFDRVGQTRSDWRFFLGLDVDFFAKMAKSTKRVVVIAGTHKLIPLQAALTRGLCNVLITDQKTSEALTAPESP